MEVKRRGLDSNVFILDLFVIEYILNFINFHDSFVSLDLLSMISLYCISILRNMYHIKTYTYISLQLEKVSIESTLNSS